MAYISRDPFARTEMHRESVPASALSPNVTCSWCGNRNGRGGLYRYRTEGDANPSRPGAHRGLFCSKPCHDDFHG